MARTAAMRMQAQGIRERTPMSVDSDSEDDMSPMPEASPSGSASLRSEPATPPPEPSRSPSKSSTNGAKKPGPQLIGHLPRAEKEAMRVFEELQGNHYQYSTLGRSREALESMTCDCQFVPGEDDPYIACGDGSDCINRLTQVECVEGDCRCRGHCQNQRMQRRQHAQLEVVLTEKKGFGLRAGTNIDKDAFIYEYIGDVVNQASFAKRMRDYADEGIRHFYFMMLQKDEFIDATKRGGIGRFANHSCNPNCYVAKWTVGEHVRMGIYAKRSIRKEEELTFNYNVDRYGHEAQQCYCGEANCVGVLGGKTQTDVAAMDDLYLDALGISDEVETLGLKGSKKKKGKKLDEDYTPILKPLTETDIPKVVQAVRQTQSRKVLLKLLTRIKMTEDQSALRQLMRLRGFSLMCNILEDFVEDTEICTIVLEGISAWPLLQRNKIEDSKIEEHVIKLGQTDNDRLKELSEKLISQWATLEIGYRIPKRLKEDDQELTFTLYDDSLIEESIASKRKRLNQKEAEDLNEAWKKALKSMEESHAAAVADYKAQSKANAKAWAKADAKTKAEARARAEARVKARNEAMAMRKAGRTSPSTPTEDPAPAPAPKAETVPKPKEETSKEKQAQAAKDLIEGLRIQAEKAREAAEAEAKQAAEIAKKAAEKEKEKLLKKSTQLSEEEKEALKEKKLHKLVGAVVVKCMSKHRDQMSHDEFKEHAKELTQLNSEKEKKSHSYQSGKLDSLSDEKTAKIKKFAKEYIAKLLRRISKSKAPVQLASTSAGTPLSDTGSGTARSGSHTLVEAETLDLDNTPVFDGDAATATNGKEDRMSVDGDGQSPNSTPAPTAPNFPKASRWDQPASVAPNPLRSPAKDPRARPDYSKGDASDRRPSTSS